MTNDVKLLEEKAVSIRRRIIKMLSEAKSGHPGGSLSSADIVTALYFSVMKHDPKNPQWEDRDKFHMSKGHACPVWYSALIEAGYIAEEHAMSLRKLGGLLQGHPSVDITGIECSSGSLGQGLSVAAGMALSAKMDKKDNRIYCLMGDGEIQEGNIWEAAMLAAHYSLDNVCGIVDCNGLQIDGKVEDVMNVNPVTDKFAAFGWHVIEADGHDISSLLAAFDEAKTVKGKPSVVVAKTVKGKGVSFMEHNAGFHGVTPNQEETEQALKELGEG